MKNYKIRFINHASFSIEWEKSFILMDPWYTGRIFNDSWSLLQDTDIKEIEGIEKISSIVISHEHPDHLHFPTLKKIRDKFPNNQITLYFPLRKDSSVKNAIEKMGFEFKYLQPSTPIKINEDLSLCSFPTGHDSGIVFDLKDKILLNQNDAYFTDLEISQIKQIYPSIDYWWMQFSLAGYYANKEDKEGMKSKGHDFHIERFKHYQDLIEPKVSIPFASFCYFCKHHNSYINDYAVKPWQLYRENYFQRTLFYNQQLEEGYEPDDYEDGKSNSDLKWEKVYLKSLKIDSPPEKVSLEKLMESANKLFDMNDTTGGPSDYFFLYDYPALCLYLYFNNKHCFIANKIHDPNIIAGISSSEEIYSYLKFPWGADTLNVTGCFEIKNESVWKAMLQYRDSLYKREVAH